MANQIVSLAYYVSRAKRANVGKDEIASCRDYREFLSERVDIAAAVALWLEMYEADDALVPLSEIDLAHADCLDIADQIYGGRPFREVRLTLPPAPPPPINHEPYFHKYLATIPSDKRTPAAVDATIGRMNEIIEAKIERRANGLVVGRVQSGKTRNYIGLMLKAADEGWNVIIVLTSAIRSLALQTRNRIVNDFANSGANNRQFVHELDFLSKNPPNHLAGAELNGDFLYWGVSMKQVNGLERVRDWFNIPGQPHKSMRVMIIDDEADNATPDSNAGDGGNYADDELDDAIGAIRTAAGFDELADWFDALRESEWPDVGAITSEARTFGEINDLIKNKSKRDIRDELVNKEVYRKFLDMDKFSDPPVQNLITEYFNRARGDGDDTCGEFVLILKSILDISRERSAINSAICQLIGKNSETGDYAYPFSRCAYLGYTATPYANILNEGPKQSPIYADFIQSLPMAPQYFGTEAIFGCGASLDDENVETNMPIVLPVPNDELGAILAPLRQSGTLPVDKRLFCDAGQEKVEWASMKKAVAWAFCTAAVRRFRRRQLDDERKREARDCRWTTMIVNVHHTQAIHGIVQRVLNDFIEAQCGDETARSSFAEFCRSVWEEQTRQFTLEKFNELFNSHASPDLNYGDGVADYPEWMDIQPDLAYFLDGWRQCVHVITINSTGTGQASQSLYNQDDTDSSGHTVMQLTGDHLWIVSGGNTISRGLTLPGLTVSYFDRVRKGTCVDTLTQMGRWFGYRPGYELLPRIWMSAESVVEIRRIAYVERELHDSIADNFARGLSPREPAHFQRIYSWGRGLSGRARALKILDVNVGTMAGTNYFFESEGNRRLLGETCETFLRGLRDPVERSPETCMASAVPLWENVDYGRIRKFLEDLLPLYPEQSRKILRGMIRNISMGDSVNWDVVLANPNPESKEKTKTFAGQSIHCGAPGTTPVGEGVFKTVAAFQYMACYAMIPAAYLWREDWRIVWEWHEQIAEAINQKRILNGDRMPRQYEEALPGDSSMSIEDRLEMLVPEYVKHGDDVDLNEVVPVPEAIHSRLGDVEGLSQGYRRRSAGDYMARVHKNAGHVRPTLQFYVFRPEGAADDAVPQVSVSFYLPNPREDFFTVCVDEDPDSVRMVTPRVFCRNVQEILAERDFPVQRKELLRLVIGRLGLRCSENFFDANIRQPLAGFRYHKMEGRNAYCIDGWAKDEEAKMSRLFVEAAVGVLQRERREFTAPALVEQVVAEQPKFRDFFDPARDASALNALMTEEVLEQNGIAVLSRRPVTYIYRG